ncbi:Cell division cycle protein-like protein [Melia azedarach]|uniref:Cell division cycle protein-like protein n=1 Tax=Melia azedarach TaxID=155640 RepID=A0ACC1Y4Q5_MELAZ|nr:Cell division cycle protein-like protein [Melia azedarach]
MAGNNPRSVLLTLFIFAMVLSPMLPSEAARFPANGLGGVMLLRRPAVPPPAPCPACVCCAPAPPGRCCPCGRCAAP